MNKIRLAYRAIKNTSANRRFVKSVQRRASKGIMPTKQTEMAYDMRESSVAIGKNSVENIRNFWNEVATAYKGFKNVL